MEELLKLYLETIRGKGKRSQEWLDYLPVDQPVNEPIVN